MNKIKLLTGLGCLSLSGLASAALFSPTSATLSVGNNGGSTFLEDVNASHEIAHTINGAGLNGPLSLSATHERYTGATGGRIRNAVQDAANGNAGTASLTLGLPDDLVTNGFNGLALWNGGEDDRPAANRTAAQRDRTRRGIQSATLFAIDDITGVETEIGTFTYEQFAFNFNEDDPAQVAVSDTVTADFNSFGPVVGVSTVRLEVTNFGNDNIINIGEIAFQQVPEPTSVAFLGLSALGFLVRRKR